MKLLSLEPESSASANSAMPAHRMYISHQRYYYTTIDGACQYLCTKKSCVFRKIVQKEASRSAAVTDREAFYMHRGLISVVPAIRWRIPRIWRVQRDPV